MKRRAAPSVRRGSPATVRTDSRVEAPRVDAARGCASVLRSRALPNRQSCQVWVRVATTRVTLPTRFGPGRTARRPLTTESRPEGRSWLSSKFTRGARGPSTEPLRRPLRKNILNRGPIDRLLPRHRRVRDPKRRRQRRRPRAQGLVDLRQLLREALHHRLDLVRELRSTLYSHVRP